MLELLGDLYPRDRSSLRVRLCFYAPLLCSIGGGGMEGTPMEMPIVRVSHNIPPSNTYVQGLGSLQFINN